MDALPELSLTELAARIAAREVSAVEAAEASLRRIEAAQPKLNCFIAVETERALAQARRIDDAMAHGGAIGPLAGVPLAHKDMYYRQGRVSSLGSKIRRDWVADCTSTALERLDAAGAIDLGRLNMAEFAVGATGHNVHAGHCRNPWNPDHVTGGSSSGSGAAVAARLVYGALGSDTGGSIRLPAAFCGTVGLKPTYGRVTNHGVMPLSFSLDCCGPLAGTVKDAARLLGVIAGPDPKDPTASRRPADPYEAACGRDIAGLKVGVPTSYFNENLHAEVDAAMTASRHVLADLGATLVEVAIPPLEAVNALWNVVMAAEAATIHSRFLDERREDYGAQVRLRIETGRFLPATRYIEALTLRDRALRDFADAVFRHCDALLAPTTPMPAPTIAETDLGDDEDAPEMVLRLSSFTRPISYLGLPALSVPCGFSDDGMPIGLQLVGRPFDEATLCALGHAYQEATEWHHRRPALAAIDQVSR